MKKSMFWKIWVLISIVNLTKATRASYMIDQLATCHHQQLGTLFYVKEHFGQNGIVIASEPFLGLCVNVVVLFLWVLL